MGESTIGINYRVVAGVDLSETGDHALREAMRLCRTLFGSELHVTYVIGVARDMHSADRLAELESVLEARFEQLREHVSGVLRPEHGDAYSHQIVFHVRLGEPAEALHQVAVDVDADLIVVGTHARAGVERLLLGSVAEALVRNARVPVLVARPKHFGDLPRTERADPLRPGEDLSCHGLTNRLHLEFVPRTTHIPGLL